MKKLFVIAVCASVMLSSCATITNGAISDCQRTKPLTGQPHRKVKVWALLVDGPVGWIIDFSTGAIYKKGGCGK